MHNSTSCSEERCYNKPTMPINKSFIVRILFLVCLIFSFIAIYYSTTVLHNYNIRTNENGIPDLDISYD